MNLVQRRSLLYQMVRRDFEQRYIGSAVGWLWGLIHPVVMLASWVFVFHLCMKIELPRGSVTESYPLYLLAGSLPWFLFNETVLRSSTSLVDNANLITKTVFPSELIPLSVFFSSLINHLFTLTVLVTAVVFWQKHWSWNLALLPLYILLTGMIAVGLGWVIAAVQVYLRDTAQAVAVFLQLWFWVTPIFVFEKDYPAKLQFLLDYNPMAFLVKAYRDAVLSSKSPDLEETVILIGWAAASFVIGGLCFRHLKRGFADVL